MIVVKILLVWTLGVATCICIRHGLLLHQQFALVRCELTFKSLGVGKDTDRGILDFEKHLLG